MVWKRDNGTKSKLNHVRTFHKVVLETYEASLYKTPLAKKRKTVGVISELNKNWAEKGCKKYSLDSNKQKEFEKNVVLLVGKGLVPMYIVEDPWFACMMLHFDSKLTRRHERRSQKSF